MIERKQILVVTPNEELATALTNAFSRYDVDIQNVSTYTEAIESVQKRSTDLLVTEYFLACGDKKEELEDAFETRNWEVDLIEYDMKLFSFYQDDLMWLRGLISQKNKEKLFPLGRRLSIESDLFMVKNILLWGFYDSPFFQEEMEGIALYFNEYGRYLYYSIYEPKITSKEFCKFLEEKKVIELQKVY